MPKKKTILFSAFLVLIIPCAVFALSVESLVMPGKVIQGHAKYENECKKCHEPFSMSSQRRLCIECHKKVAEDIKQQSGFHGRLKNISEVECKHCHTDHKGRGADILQLDKDVFNHQQTDFILKGSHFKVACERCHQKSVKYRDAPMECQGCHKQKEPHSGNLGEKCESCHEEQEWKKFRFDHKKTKFPLVGFHQQVKCIACHPGQHWKNTPEDCFSCHRLNDIHGGKYGKKCNDCHSLVATKQPILQLGKNVDEKKSNWKNVSYSHDKTKFPLRDKHVGTACTKCHSGNLYDRKQEITCYSCHKNDDQHKGRYGSKCDVCHTPKQWKKTTFDHAKTKFPLTGKHIKVTCNKCHIKPVTEQKLAEECDSCHSYDDKHRRSYGTNCKSCHTSENWKGVTYDHSKTKFPLKEGHEKVECVKCHPVASREKPGITCDSCHVKDDYHKGQEGKECERCHNQSSWRNDVFFDHDLTRFPLIGMHAIVLCEECHLGGNFKDTPKDCITCHLTKDEHTLRLGPFCSQCHTPNGWKLWLFDHNSQTKFNLDGKHQDLECVACHTSQVQKTFSLSSSCFSCHKTDDTHLGRFGKHCDRCHVASSFRELRINQFNN